jgi:ankyrin repeat protein
VSNNSQALFSAIAAHDLDRVQQLLAAGVSANSQDENGKTALQLASEQGNNAIVAALLSAGATRQSEPTPIAPSPGIFPPSSFSMRDLIAQAVENTDEETQNFYAGFMNIMEAFSGQPSTSNEVANDTPVSPPIAQFLANQSTGSVMDQPIPVLLTGQKGNYFGTEFSALPDGEPDAMHLVHRHLEALNFRLCGQITATQFFNVEVYGYVAQDGYTCASVMKTGGAYRGLDLVSCFADDAFLTTTTTNLKNQDYQEQKLFRRSHSDLDVMELWEKHGEYVAKFQEKHGDRQPLFSDLRSIAVLIEVYTQRQESNPQHGLLTFANALNLVEFPQFDPQVYSTGSEEPGDNEENDDDDDILRRKYKPENAQTPLVGAILRGDIDDISRLLEDGAELNRLDCGVDAFPLGIAIAEDRADIVEMLLNAGASPGSGDYGYTGLTLAVRYNHLEVFQLLLDAGADVDQGMEDDYRVIIEAAALGRLEMVKRLVEAGADINAYSEGDTALMRAAYNGHREVYDFLYPLVNAELRAYGDRHGEETIQAALKRIEREKGKDVERFIDAAMMGEVENVRRAIAQGINVNLIGSNAQTALMYAANYGHMSILHLLLDAGADPNILSDGDEGLGDGMTALMHVAVSFFAGNREQVIELLVSRGADINLQGKGGKTALMWGLQYTASVQTLINAGADLNLRDDNGNTALMLASLSRYHKTVEMLKQAGASEDGMSAIALSEAVDNGDVKTVNDLIASGVNVNHNAGAALMRAISKGDAEIVDLLLQAGADINLGGEAFTPLARAASEGYLELVQKLIAAGANVHTRCHNGDSSTALEYARMGLYENYRKGKGHAEIIEILEKYSDL